MLQPYDIDFSTRGETLADPQFSQRWSPRAFEKVAIPQEQREKIFDAIRYSPSAFNTQPWRILASKSHEGAEFERFLKLLVERNQIWARNSSVLGFMVAANHFDTGKENRWAFYDCGFAWASLTFQAAELGYYAHGMAGIQIEKVYDEFDISRERFTVVAGFAIGKLANSRPEELPDLHDSVKKREFPQKRKPLSEVYFPGGIGL